VFKEIHAMTESRLGEKKGPVAQSLRPFGTSVFTEMTNLANANGAVNLSQGFPDFEGPEEVRARAAEAIMRGPNQYCPSIGIPRLRQAVSRKMMRFYGVDVDPETEVTVTAGSTEGICATLLGIIEPGDEVILMEPTYDSYPPLASLALARIRYVPLNLPDFSLPKDILAKAFNSKTKAIIINSPQNPCGKVFTLEELSFIASLCEKYDAYAVGDEVYEHLVYDGRKHVPLLAVPRLRHRAFSISSTAKTLSLTGWKQGFVVAAPDLSRAVRMSHQFITFCGQSALQEGVTLGIDSSESYYERLLDDYSRKRSFLCDGLRQLGFRVFVPEGTYYALADIRSVGFEDDVAFCRMLPVKARVAAIPCSAFYFSNNPVRHLVRFAFCKKDETLREALRRLMQWKGGLAR